LTEKVCPKGHPYTFEPVSRRENPNPDAPCCPICFEEWERLTEIFKPIVIEVYDDEFPGCFNHSADEMPRTDKAWSDTNLDFDYSQRENWDEKDSSFVRLKCRGCGGVSFEVLHTGSYETSAKCCMCGMYYVVHNG